MGLTDFIDPSQWDDPSYDTSLDSFDPSTGLDPNIFGGTSTITGNFDPSQFQGIDPNTGNPAGLIAKILGGSQPGQNLADLSKVLGGFSSGEKANRAMQGDFTQKYDQSMLAAQQARNANESDAMKKLYQTSYLQNGGSHFQLPATLSLGGVQHTVPNPGYGPSPASAAQKQGASTLQSQLLARLMPGGSYTPQPLSTYATPGTSEQIGNFGAVGAGGLGAISNILGNQ
jgi:hypothetical protein